MIISIYLAVSDGIDKRCSALMTHGQKGDLVFEVNKSLDNDSTGSAACALLCRLPAHGYI